MNYEKHYNLLIDKSRHRTIEGYKERHHIVPKAFGGSNKKENLVDLYAREHFIAHMLLYKMQTSKRAKHQMLTACVMMTGKNSHNSKLYELARKKFSKLHSESISGVNSIWYGTSRSGDQNPFYGKTHTAETREKLSNLAKNKVIVKNIFTGEIIKVSKAEFDNNSDLVGITKNKQVSEEIKIKISKSLKNRSICICPYCNKSGTTNMTRYHFENCKFKQQL